MVNNKSKVYDLICGDNISIDSEGNFIFINNLQRDISNNFLTYNDALNIVLKLLFLARINKIRYRDVSRFQINLINEIKNVNRNFNKSMIKKKKKKIFNRSYFEERNIVDNYITELIRINKIKNPSAISINKNFINHSYKHSVKEKKNHFSRRDYCFILGIHPDLTFEKEKSLRNILKSEFEYYDLDSKILSHSSKEEIKKHLDEARNNENKIKKEKNELKEFFNKINEFNFKSIEEMLSLEDKYSYIYNKLNENYFDMPEIYESSVITFKFLFENINKFDKFIEIKNELNVHSDNVSKFNRNLSKNIYFNNFEREKLDFNQFTEIFSLVKAIPREFRSLVLRDLDEINLLIRFFNDIKRYVDISNSKEDNLIRKHNESFLDNQINQNKDFFTDISDINKKRAIVLDTDNIKVIAGAGTGKTYLIEKKIQYLIEKKKISPDKILCLCFTRKSTNELKNRVDNDDVAIYTFHEFARIVDDDCGGNKTTNRYLLNDVIRKYIQNVNDNQLKDLIEYFSYYIMPPDEVDELQKELDEYENPYRIPTLKRKYHQKGMKKVTLQGEVVKSIEEMIISNYLFMHNIEYEYERRYGHSVLDLINRFSYSANYFCIKDIPKKDILLNFIDSQKRWYKHKPDFYLPEYDLYLEHFGVDKNRQAMWLDGKRKRDYEEGVRSKIIWHKICGTKLINTCSYHMSEGRLVEKLETILRENNVKIGQIDKKDVLETLSNISYFKDFEKFNKLVKAFIDIFEAKHLKKEEFEKFKKKNQSSLNGYDKKRTGLFLDIVEDIYEQYYKYNQGSDIDHNREISNALELIKEKKYQRMYDYILIDEYQDINDVRCMLIQELQKNTNSKLFVVGDDWQSIYKFNGSDVHLFIDFNKYFKNPEVLKLEESRRCPQKINEIARDFILKNPKQEDKKLIHYKKNISNPNPIKIVSYPDNDYKRRVLYLEAIINDIVEKNNKPGLRILLLGRGKDDIEKFIYQNIFSIIKQNKTWKVVYSKDKSLKIHFMSIHQSKGLEYDEVVILNFENHRLGFPNKIEDDSVLRFLKTPDEYSFAEERRLLYVALTRTKNNVYLLSPRRNYSIFIDEIKKRYNIEEYALDINIPFLFNRRSYTETWVDTNLVCPECGEGKIAIVFREYTYKKATSFVRCSKKCGYNGGTYPSSMEDIKYVEKCPSCRGILVRRGNMLRCCLNYHEGCMEKKELKLDEEELGDEL